MGLPEHTVVVRFEGGIETKQDKKTIGRARLTDLQNCVFTKRGTLSKRFGYENLGKLNLAGGSVAGGVGLGVREDEMVLFSEDKAYSYVSGLGKWDEIGPFQPVKVSTEVVANTPGDQTLADFAQNDGVALYAWVDSAGGIYYSVLDVATSRALVSPTLLTATGVRPRVAAIGSTLQVYWVDTPSKTIWSRRTLTSEPERLLDPVELVVDISSSTPNYDIDASTDDAVIAWQKDGGQIGVGYVTAGGALGSPVSGYPSAVTCPTAGSPGAAGPAIAKDAGGTGQICVVYSGATGATGTFVESDLTSFGPTFGLLFTFISKATVAFLRDETDSGERAVQIFYERSAAAAQDYYVESRVFDAGGLLSSTVRQRGVKLASKAFALGGHVFAHLVRETTYFRTYYTIREDGLLVARYLPGLAGDSPTEAHLPNVSVAGLSSSWAANYRSRVESANSDVFTEKGIRLATLDFDALDKLQSVQMGKTLYVAGGMLHAYDGSNIVEAGFHDAPDDIATPTQGAAAAGGLSAGTYSYRFAYERTNGQGEIDIGPVSVGVQVVVTGTARAVTFVVPTYRLTRKEGVRIGVFRTLAGDSSAYYRVSSLDPTSSRYLANNSLIDSVSFTDEMSDAELETQEPLYTNGGILSNDPIAGGQIVATGKDRIYTNDPSDPNVVRYTQQRREGYQAEFSPRLKVQLDPYGGDITGIVVMDESVIVFKETAIYFFAGPGPLANPDAGGGFTEPQLITSDVGCINGRSIGYTPEGILFQSQKGLYLLGRDRTVRYVGAPVEAFNGQRVRSTDLIPDRTQIRVLTDSGRTLLYDYYFDQWSTFTNHTGLDAVIVGGVYHYLRLDGSVWKENSGYSDDGRQIKAVIETAPIHYLTHLQSWEFFRRALLLGNYKSPHTLVARIARDDRQGWRNPIEVDSDDFIVQDGYGDGAYGAGAFGGSTDDRYQVKFHLGFKGQSIRFRFEDAQPVGEAGASFELTELILTGSTMGRSAKLNAERMA